MARFLGTDFPRDKPQLPAPKILTDFLLPSDNISARSPVSSMNMKASILATTIALVAAGTLRAADPALTIYNQGFAVVRDSLPIDLKPGVNNVVFAGATAKLEADSVILRDVAGKTALQILEQSYRNDPVSQSMVLSFFEGNEVDFVRRETNKPDVTVRGKVIRSGFVPGGESVEPIIEVGGKLQFSLPGEPIFPALGENSILKPTLAWKLNAAAAAKIEAEIAYVTQGFTWEASYNLVAPEKGDFVDFVGWITMKNDSGTAFQNAKIKLMAGDVNKVQPPQERMDKFALAAAAPMAEAAPVVTEKSFDEFHLYTLANPATLRDKETKQVEFVRATGVKAERLYIYDGIAGQGWQRGIEVGGEPGYGLNSSKKVAVHRQFKNAQANKLGIPLPKGRVRFYSQDEPEPGNAGRQLEFVGENTIDHTPKDELVRLYIGDSFDLVGERKRTDFKVANGDHWAEDSFEIKVSNRKKEPVEIRVVEHLYRWANWELKTKSQDFEKTDAQTIEFKVALKPDEEKTVTYKVRYTW